MCFSDKKLLLFTTILTATIFVYKRNELSTSDILVLCSD